MNLKSLLLPLAAILISTSISSAPMQAGGDPKPIVLMSVYDPDGGGNHSLQIVARECRHIFMCAGPSLKVQDLTLRDPDAPATTFRAMVCMNEIISTENTAYLGDRVGYVTRAVPK